MVAWRKVLKDLIAYFRELQKANETRAKSVASASNTLVNIQTPANFLTTGGLADAQHILRDFHKLVQAESNKSRDLENEVVLQLTGLRSDLQQKIKEIKGLSSDFKNSVTKEQEGTKKAVRALQDALSSVDNDAAGTSGKNDPFLVKMAVDRQLERHIEEENYLHRVSRHPDKTTHALTEIGISQPRGVRSRARVDCSRRSPEGLQHPCWDYEAGSRRIIRDRGKAQRGPSSDAEGSRVGQFRDEEQLTRRSKRAGAAF